MVTLRQLYQQFGHDPKWTRFATASTTPMATVYLRKLGDRDITSLSDFDLALQLAMSDQPEDRKVKAKACMQHLLNWAAEHGHTDIPSCTDEPKEQKDDRTETRRQVADVHPDNNRQRRVSPSAKPDKTTTRKAKSDDKKRTEPKPKPKPTARRKSDKEVKPKPKAIVVLQPKPERKHKQADELDREKWLEDTRPRRGTIYHDNASKGYSASGKRVFKDCWRAEITIAGQRFRHRSKEREDCVAWLKAVKQGKIKPTDNKADWWRMEQHKDEEARIDELIVSAAEEANIVYEYWQTGDTEILYNYCIKALLPHMVYYCAHSLHLGRDRSLKCSRQAVGLILTKIVGGRPVTNITFTCKRMLRTYKNRGDFWYYDKAPEAVKLMVNRIDMSALEELYKVTKDRRI